MHRNNRLDQRIGDDDEDDDVRYGQNAMYAEYVNNVILIWNYGFVIVELRSFSQCSLCRIKVAPKHRSEYFAELALHLVRQLRMHCVPLI